MLRNVKVGDVLRAPSGLLRVVRHVSTGRSCGPSVTFTIQHCSWTGRSITSYTLNELSRMGYVKTRAKLPLTTKFDKLMEWDIACPPRELQHFDCCDVKGIP
jgi:hypothetical protein